MKEKISNIFGDWRIINDLPRGLNTIEKSGDATIISTVWDGGKIRRARLCELDVPGKFCAETLVIYPDEYTEVPIFGCEYLSIGGKKFFGGIDFHPLSKTEEYAREYIQNYLGDLPDSSVKSSRFYNLDLYFSKKFWLKKDSDCFYEEYVKNAEEYLKRYLLCLEEAESTHSMWGLHKKYDNHMGERDPAHGILKAYFSEEFADFYIKNFLFNLADK